MNGYAPAPEQTAITQLAAALCGLDLTDERSTSAGYGPICAGKYGLPWGEVPTIEKQEG